MMSSGKTRLLALLASFFVAFTLISVDFAEARRGGSFGSRGSRTFQQAPPTRTAPNQTGPVERTMTPNPGTNPATNNAARQNPAATQRPAPFGGMSGMMRGLLLGGFIGMLLGYGFGGAAGMLGFLLQLLVFGFLAYLLMGFLRRRQQPEMAGGPKGGPDNSFGGGNDFRNMNRDNAGQNSQAGSFGFGGQTQQSFGMQPQVETQDIQMQQEDLETFERRLGDVQRAFADEDHAALRRLSTPEMVSFFSEELAENAQRGVRNEVSGLRLVEADIAEAWSEGNEDYATAAFRYESVDVMRDRKTGRIVEGDGEPSEVVELWTFVRRRGEDWKLSAIQEAG